MKVVALRLRQVPVTRRFRRSSTYHRVTCERIDGHRDRPIVRMHLLGSMRGTTYLGDDVLPRGKKARAILACLCLAAGERVPRARLASLLWDRVPDTQARTSFRQALREMLRAMGPLADELISADRENIRLDVRLCWIDAVAVLASEPSDFSALRSDLAALCTGELLEGLDGLSASFDQWLLGERTRFSERLTSLHETELAQVLDRGRSMPSKCAGVARRLIAFDPTHEGASRVLMRALTDMGERAQALREYARCREALQKDRSTSSRRRRRARSTRRSGRCAGGRTDGTRTGPERIASGAGRKRTLSRRHRQAVACASACCRSWRAARCQEENLAFSLSQEIAAALARFRWFDVIAPVSLARRHSASFVSENQLKRQELDYVVDGALSGNGEKFQISVRLLDLAQYARPVWSERFELAVGQLHQVDELVTARIVGQIDPVILYIEGQPRRRKHYGATGLLLLAIPLMYSMEREKYEEAGQLINRALQDRSRQRHGLGLGGALAGLLRRPGMGAGRRRRPLRSRSRMRSGR